MPFDPWETQMFNRNRNQTGQQGAVASAFDDVLAELGSRGEAAPTDEESPEESTAEEGAEEGAEDTTDQPTDDPDDESGKKAGKTGAMPGSTAKADRPAKDRILEHADTLRATRDAQHRAQEMLALAATARSEATDQAEQIVLEAKAAADQVRADADDEAERTRREAVEWVKEQRMRVESATALLSRNAERDAENIRTEAMRSAMAEAEQTARLYVGEAAARGARDAEEIRGSAREVLHRAAELGADLKTTMADLVSALEIATGAVSDQLYAIDSLLDEVRRDTTRGATATEDDDETATATDTATDEAVEKPDIARADAEDDEAGGSSTEGRQLGSLFRDQG